MKNLVSSKSLSRFIFFSFLVFFSVSLFAGGDTTAAETELSSAQSTLEDYMNNSVMLTIAAIGGIIIIVKAVMAGLRFASRALGS